MIPIEACARMSQRRRGKEGWAVRLHALGASKAVAGRRHNEVPSPLPRRKVAFGWARAHRFPLNSPAGILHENEGVGIVLSGQSASLTKLEVNDIETPPLEFSPTSRELAQRYANIRRSRCRCLSWSQNAA
jgi:hypothetical protein